MSNTGPDRFEQRLWAQLRPLLDERGVVETRQQYSAVRPSARTDGRRSTQWPATVLVVALVFTAFGVIALTRGRAGVATFAERLDGERVRVPLDPTTYGGDVTAARAELEMLGLDVQIERPTGSPSVAGTFHFVRVDPDAAGVRVDEGRPGDSGAEPTAIIDLDEFDGVVTLVVPRPVPLGDLPVVAGSAFGEGEPLAGLWCRRWPVTSRRLAAAADARGVVVRWETVTSVVPDSGDGPVTSFSVDASQGRLDGTVVAAQVATTGLGSPPGTVVATVLPDDVPAPTSMRDRHPRLTGRATAAADRRAHGGGTPGVEGSGRQSPAPRPGTARPASADRGVRVGLRRPYIHGGGDGRRDLR